jgi:GNAT superfamily N-acetyltransferase
MKKLSLISRILYACVFTLIGSHAYAMESGTTPTGRKIFMRLYDKEMQKHARNTCLSRPFYDHARQDIYLDGAVIGAIYYADFKKDGIVTRDVLNVCVKIQGKGLGTKAMQELIAQSERNGVSKIILYSVPKAVPFYERLGFTHVGPGNRHFVKYLEPLTNAALITAFKKLNVMGTLINLLNL